jgi:hypothetical protein
MTFLNAGDKVGDVDRGLRSGQALRRHDDRVRLMSRTLCGLVFRRETYRQASLLRNGYVPVTAVTPALDGRHRS